MRFPTSKPNPELEALLKRAGEFMDAMTPTERAVMSMRQRVSYVASEMTVDDQDNVVRSREEADAIVSKSEPALILAELDARAAEITRLKSEIDRIRAEARNAGLEDAASIISGRAVNSRERAQQAMSAR